MEDSSDIPSYIIDDPLMDITGVLGVSWGFGNKLYAFPRSIGNQTSHKNIAEGEVCVYPITWSVDLNDVYSRKLINQSRNYYLDVQTLNSQMTSSDIIQKILCISRKYRSQIRETVYDYRNESASRLESDRETSVQLDKQRRQYAMIETVWNLCEIMFIDSLPGGMLLLRLLDWVQLHYSEVEQEAMEIIEADEKSKHPLYWAVIYKCLFQGKFVLAKELLAFQSSRKKLSKSLYEQFEELLDTMPFFQPNYSLLEFSIRWKRWMESVTSSLISGLFATNPDLEAAVLILSGDMSVLLKLKHLFTSSLQVLVARLLYSKPTALCFDVQQELLSAIDVFGGLSKLSASDALMVSVVRLDLHQVISDCSQVLASSWMAAHLTDLLIKKPDTGLSEELRVSLVVDYALSLLTHPSLWQIGVDYLAHCGPEGRSCLELSLAAMPIHTEHKARKLLSVCRHLGLHDTASGICREMGMMCLQHRRLGNALYWATNAEDADLASMVAVKLLTEYESQGSVGCLDILDNLGSDMMISEELTFVGKYQEFHRLYQNEELQEAASLLLGLLSSQLAPKAAFQFLLLVDCLPLLETGGLFTSEETYEILHCLEEYLDKRDTWTRNDSQRDVKTEAETPEHLELLRVALARNLSASLISEMSSLQI